MSFLYHNDTRGDDDPQNPSSVKSANVFARESEEDGTRERGANGAGAKLHSGEFVIQ